MSSLRLQINRVRACTSPPGMGFPEELPDGNCAEYSWSSGTVFSGFAGKGRVASIEHCTSKLRTVHHRDGLGAASPSLIGELTHPTIVGDEDRKTGAE